MSFHEKNPLFKIWRDQTRKTERGLGSRGVCAGCALAAHHVRRLPCYRERRRRHTTAIAAKARNT